MWAKALFDEGEDLVVKPMFFLFFFTSNSVNIIGCSQKKAAGIAIAEQDNSGIGQKALNVCCPTLSL